MKYKSAQELIGNTPLIRLSNIEKKLGLQCKLYAKVEFFNPTGSVKDRAAAQMMKDARRKKGLNIVGGTIIEPTSGNTGIAIAALCAWWNYRCILVMPESMSIERRKLLQMYGAEIVLTDAKLGMKGSVDKAVEIQKTIPGSVILDQFNNPANPYAHYIATGKEIYTDLSGKIDMFVASFGTGGTVSGVGKYLKGKRNSIEVIGVEPASSPLVTKGVAGSHKIQGIGANFIPSTLDLSVVDRVVTVTDEEAFEYARIVPRREGLLVGISSGAALKAAIDEAKKIENTGKTIVVLFPDSGDRYLSTPLFDFDK